MAVYCVTGKLGSGKTLACVGRIRDALRRGLRVATNLDIFVEELCPELVRSPDGWKGELMRLPDQPRLRDLEAIGQGGPSKREKDFGLLVLDEMAMWLNTRDFQDKERAGVIKWFRHMRKLHWHGYFLVQHHEDLDKQPRQAMLEHHVSCRRTDRLRLPFLGRPIKALTGIDVRPPQVHLGTVRYGTLPTDMVVDRWWYRGHELYKAYDTDQMFSDDGEVGGPATMLSPWLLKGRYLPPPPRKLAQRLLDVPAAVVELRALEFVQKPTRALSEKLPLVRLLARLPESDRIRHFRRLDALGAFG